MSEQTVRTREAAIGAELFGFRLLKKEYVASKAATLYTMQHIKTGAELLYFDRADENKTFAICFKTLPEDDTGVFHILEHSVLNGSKKYPVKEPFVVMLQSSMQTFLNAMTFRDKTVYPVSSRNEQDFFNLMSIYMDAVFCPRIYEKPEIFMQEGWHYEFESPEAEPYYNGVVFSEMKGVYANVLSLMQEEIYALLFPDNSYRFSSGGHPAHITDLTYEQFVATHKRFYHPTNAKIFLDGAMDIDAVLRYMDEEYLCKYEYRANDFDFVRQVPKAAEKTVTYQSEEGQDFAHIAISRILCDYDDVEKIYAASILADYLAGSNEAPLKRAFLEKGIAQDVVLDISDSAFQPTVSVIVKNTAEARFDEIKDLLCDTVKALLAQGLNKKALSACLEQFSFQHKQIQEPFGVVLALNALSSWLYGADPLTHIDNAGIFASLREKLSSDYFEKLLAELFADKSGQSYLYVLPAPAKGAEDAQAEQERLLAAVQNWTEEDREKAFASFTEMTQWQMSMDDEEAMGSLPHLELADIPEQTAMTEKTVRKIAGCDVLEVKENTNGIVYLNLYFDVSGLTLEELRKSAAVVKCLGQLNTENYAPEELQNEIKAKMGEFSAKMEVLSQQGRVDSCTPYVAVSASMLEENVGDAVKLIAEILLRTRFGETQKIQEMLVQQDYAHKQSLIAGGHMYAVTKSLSASSMEAALKEQLEGEGFVQWFADFVNSFGANPAEEADDFLQILGKTFGRNNLFVAYSGHVTDEEIGALIEALPAVQRDKAALALEMDPADSAIEIPASVGFSSLGHNLYALGGAYTGSCAVLSSLMSFSYLWNMIRVQGGAYGTGMNISPRGDIFCYSFRDPNLENTRNALFGMADFVSGFVDQGMPLDDIIIGTVNTTDPLLDPSGKCTLEATRYLRGITGEDIAKIRKEILHTTAGDLLGLVDLLTKYAQTGKFCGIGDKNAIAFLRG